MMSTHGRSFFLYSNGIVSPMKAMFVHEIDISGFVRWTSGWVVIFSSRFGIDIYSDPVCSHSMVWIRISHNGRRYAQSSGYSVSGIHPLKTFLVLGCFFNRVSISSVFIMHCSQTRFVCFYQFRSRCQVCPESFSRYLCNLIPDLFYQVACLE